MVPSAWNVISTGNDGNPGGEVTLMVTFQGPTSPLASPSPTCARAGHVTTFAMITEASSVIAHAGLAHGIIVVSFINVLPFFLSDSAVTGPLLLPGSALMPHLDRRKRFDNFAR